MTDKQFGNRTPWAWVAAVRPERIVAVLAVFMLAGGSAFAQTRTTWISASDLSPELPTTAELINQGDFYYGNIPALNILAVTGYFTARLDLPDGTMVSSLRCHFRDQDAASDGSAHVLRVYEYDSPAAQSPSWQPIISLGTSGATGFQRLDANVPFSIVHHGTDSTGNAFNQFYVLYVIMPPLNLGSILPLLSSVTFRGCEVVYTPAP